MKWINILFLVLVAASCSQKTQKNKPAKSDNMMIRIAELEIDPIHFEKYISILKEEAEASVRLESGVISIYPMFEKKNPTTIRILEIYKNKEAYESHLQTTHFKHYKASTLQMVKSLKLVDMEAIDKETMAKIFIKL